MRRITAAASLTAALMLAPAAPALAQSPTAAVQAADSATVSVAAAPTPTPSVTQPDTPKPEKSSGGWGLWGLAGLLGLLGLIPRKRKGQPQAGGTVRTSGHGSHPRDEGPGLGRDGR